MKTFFLSLVIYIILVGSIYAGSMYPALPFWLSPLGSPSGFEVGDALLIEIDDYLLLEIDDKLLLE